ncbi:MAG TPA: hypothetical protein VGQ83_17365 [Polyangia bacterium]
MGMVALAAAARVRPGIPQRGVAPPDARLRPPVGPRPEVTAKTPDSQLILG